ncbi:MAG: gamma-glutamylcyclotransferase [Ideonella sp.]|nr:gamma-glutamylcyclotransferase [Ideonella sp.]MCC7456987.1 gamma-glutamylcyclotransferase [Nitrospira sp.]
MDTDAFVHLPALRGRLEPAERSKLRATADVMAAWDERARRLGLAPGWRLSDQQLEDTRRALLGPQCERGLDLWVYGYGSLMWDPGFHFAEVRLADLHGYQRRFSYKTHIARGTREQPALMLTLERAPDEHCCCRGLVFRIAGAAAEVESGMLWRREMLRGGYRPVLLPVSTPQGEVTALVMTANPAHADYAGELPLDETAAIIATAAGVAGTNRDYLEQLALQIDRLGIDDPYIARLLQQVRGFRAAAPAKGLP